MSAEDTNGTLRELEGRMRAFVARRVPAADIDDVVQDVLLRMQKSLRSLQDDQSFGPWLFQVARSAIAESHRQHNRQPDPVPDENLDGAPSADDASPTPLETELATYVVPFVARLPSPYREAVTLTELEGLTQQAAADALGISLSCMKSRVQRGREKLRELLEERCRIAVDARGRVIECTPRRPTTCGCKNS